MNYKYYMINNPTSRLGFAVNLSVMLIYLVISVILLIIFKTIKKHKIKQSKDCKKDKKIVENKNKKWHKYIKFVFIICIIFLYIIMVKKAYAIMALTISYFGLKQIIISFLGVFTTNLIIMLMFSKKINKDNLCDIVIDTVYESMLFVIVTSFLFILRINCLFAIIFVIILKILRSYSNKGSIKEKICLIIVYIICIGFVSNCVNEVIIDSITEPGKILIRTIEGYADGKYRRDIDIIDERKY